MHGLDTSGPSHVTCVACARLVRACAHALRQPCVIVENVIPVGPYLFRLLMYVAHKLSASVRHPFLFFSSPHATNENHNDGSF